MIGRCDRGAVKSGRRDVGGGHGSVPGGRMPRQLSASRSVGRRGSGRVRVPGPVARVSARPSVELRRLLKPLRQVVGGRRWSDLSLAGGASALLLACALAQQALHGPAWLADVTAERASLPLRIALERLPGSLFAPALDLPLWGAVAQLAIA